MEIGMHRMVPIFLLNLAIVKNPINGYVIFAGYCDNDNLYQWASNTEIDITCIASEKDSVKTLSKKAYGINIRVVVEHAKST